MHPSYFPNDDGAMLPKALPTTKSYQTPVTYQDSDAANPFLADQDPPSKLPIKSSLLLDDSNSQSTVNP